MLENQITTMSEGSLKTESNMNNNIIDFNHLIGNISVKTEILSVLNVFINKRAEWVEYLKSIDDNSANAILLHGCPGVGKTAILRSIEKSLQTHPDIEVAFCSSSQFQGQVGNNASKIEQVFDKMRGTKKAACIILIDEIDGLMMKKSGLLNVQERTNAFQAELDGMKNSTNLIIIGTTNHIDSLEPAARDRFTQIDIYPPCLEDRIEFIKKFLLNINYGCPLNIDLIAKNTEGLTGRNFVQISKKLKMLE